jgi:hypothetical protein
MGDVLSMEGEITEDGRLLVELPPDIPRGRVALTLEILPTDDLELPDEDLRGLGLTAEEIAACPEIGAWAEDRDLPSGEQYVENLRRRSRYPW